MPAQKKGAKVTDFFGVKKASPARRRAGKVDGKKGKAAPRTAANGRSKASAAGGAKDGKPEGKRKRKASAAAAATVASAAASAGSEHDGGFVRQLLNAALEAHGAATAGTGAAEAERSSTKSKTDEVIERAFNAAPLLSLEDIKTKQRETVAVARSGRVCRGPVATDAQQAAARAMLARMPARFAPRPPAHPFAHRHGLAGGHVVSVAAADRAAADAKSLVATASAILCDSVGARSVAAAALAAVNDDSRSRKRARGDSRRAAILLRSRLAQPRAIPAI